MTVFPGHAMPAYSDAARDDALFHYTTASGLLGILQQNEIWSTAYYCLNDESELASGRDVITPAILRATSEMIEQSDPLVQTFRQRGVDIKSYAKKFESNVLSFSFVHLCAYVTCFFRSNAIEDFQHGLLSQWRAYGADGGYAIQFSRQKLLAALKRANSEKGLNYELQDVHYSADNPLKSEVLTHSDAFVSSFKGFVEQFAVPPQEILKKGSVSSPVSSLVGGPLEALLDYLIHTKSPHFSAESECRLSLIEGRSSETQTLPTSFFNRGGLIVPYKKSPTDVFPLADCVEWVLVGPSSRMEARLKSVTDMIKALGLRIKVRPSHIPLSTF